MSKPWRIKPTRRVARPQGETLKCDGFKITIFIKLNHRKTLKGGEKEKKREREREDENFLV